MTKNYCLKRGDLIIFTEDGLTRKVEIVKDRNVPVTHNGFEALDISNPLFKTLEIKISFALSNNEDINFKKKVIKIKEIKRS